MSEKIKNCIKNNPCVLCRAVLTLVVVGLLVAIYLQLREINKILSYPVGGAFFARKKSFLKRDVDGVHNFAKKAEKEFDEIERKILKERKEGVRKLPSGEKREKFLEKKGPTKEEREHDHSNEKKVSDDGVDNDEGEVRGGNKRNRKFVYKAETDSNEKEFIVKVKLPRTFKIEDTKVNLENQNLIIRAEKQNSENDKNTRSFSYNSFFESFSLPSTKATINDVKISLNKDNGNELVVVVPIL
jgi:HSP20 family molecular chaperone IbpA